MPYITTSESSALVALAAQPKAKKKAALLWLLRDKQLSAPTKTAARHIAGFVIRKKMSRASAKKKRK
jgi:hypothetical protein